MKLTCATSLYVDLLFSLFYDIGNLMYSLYFSCFRYIFVLFILLILYRTKINFNNCADRNLLSHGVSKLIKCSHIV